MMLVSVVVLWRNGWILRLLMQVMVQKRKRLVIGYGFGGFPCGSNRSELVEKGLQLRLELRKGFVHPLVELDFG
ncbi:hypothetical protein Hanom_Chr16g01467051 [Helianthus anomalus]